ncbi:MAG: 3-deoxy-7-phosphoheptulonate synthase [Candidatus Omnitrophica bacterium]|nr:3-deoxy-7-phosphoheptulonate synthase [Candidatus Omnitrophota bacterium]MCF7877516.1 3-deoxy-7-phosphoheptulonate synthase [Candidatus Omnitrophota bacterium]MCF7878429.1 3-deoxy-7-phosphoheptulonate synthase [Candidatus Omnitrophota bacterium]MCF7892926.1 3-deoxy-7-phosphoheptulonate synthase [Candidatus Omnitrophota bacterium]
MIIVLKKGTEQKDIDNLLKKVKSLGLKPMVSQGQERTIIGVIGPEDVIRFQPLEAYPGVDKVMPVLAPYKLVSREFKQQDSIIKVKDSVEFGSKKINIVAGPCSIETKAQLKEIAGKIKDSGASLIRGGAFKPRTSPYSFQGLGEEGLKILQDISNQFGIPAVTEVMDTRDVELVARYADVFQIGARNMQNFNLLKEVGQTKKPIILKRGLSATVKELLMSAEYILSEGNFNVILCERGIRTFSEFTRNTLDISAVPVIKMCSHLPVIVDPSHAAGKWGLVNPLSKAAVAAGADGLLVEVHPNPKEALSDGPQQLLPENFAILMKELKQVAESVGREL